MLYTPYVCYTYAILHQLQVGWNLIISGGLQEWQPKTPGRLQVGKRVCACVLHFKIRLLELRITALSCSELRDGEMVEQIQPLERFHQDALLKATFSPVLFLPSVPLLRSSRRISYRPPGSVGFLSHQSQPGWPILKDHRIWNLPTPGDSKSLPFQFNSVA